MVDVAAPTMSTYSPAQAATGVAISSDVVLTFSETVVAGSGNIVLTPSSGSATTIAIGDGQVTISTNTVTIDPSSNLLDSVQYTVTMAPGVLKDGSNNNFAGLKGTTYCFTMVDVTAPTMSTYSPAQPATRVAITVASNLCFT